VSPTYESSGLEPLPFERKDAATAFSVARCSIGFAGVIAGDAAVANQQRTGGAMSPHTTGHAVEF
jgi:hypothetical protein